MNVIRLARRWHQRPGHRGVGSAATCTPLPWLAACLLVAGMTHATAPDTPPLDAPPQDAAVAAADSSPDATRPAHCDGGYADNDAALFDFINTRRAVDYSALQGKPIRHIRHLTLPVFNPNNPDENNALYRAVNYLHIPTRTTAVHRQLLIHVGESLDPDRIHESERILRGANYLYDAMILPERVCDDGVDLLVVVRDIWTLQPAANFSRTGGQNHTSIGISDDNIFGYGHGLKLSYDKDPARSGVVLAYNSHNLFDGHTQLQLDHAKNNDGRGDHMLLERPFYALDTHYAGGIEASENIRYDTITSNGVATNEYQHQTRFTEAYTGISSGLQDGLVHRWRAGITRTSDRYDQQLSGYTDPLPEDRLLVYPWLEYERLENNFVTTLNLSQMFRNEDINIGEGWRIRAGMTSSALGSTTDAIVSAADYQNTVSIGTHHLLRNSVSASAYWNERTGRPENTLLGATTNYDFFIDDNNRWHAMLGADTGVNLDDVNMLTAGGDINLRGYPSSWQRGDRRVIATVERRHFYQAHPLNLFRLGSALFLDAGQAWDSTGVITQSDRVLVDVGIGLRINSSKARPDHVIHADIAFPLTERGGVNGVQISIQSNSAF